MKSNLLVFILLLVGITSYSQADTAKNSKSYFVIVVTIGEKFEKGKPVLKQDIADHGEYMKQLYAEGSLVMAGPFTDNDGALIVLYVDSEEKARTIMNNDPAVKKKIFSETLHKWQVFFNALQ